MGCPPTETRKGVRWGVSLLCVTAWGAVKCTSTPTSCERDQAGMRVCTYYTYYIHRHAHTCVLHVPHSQADGQ